MIDREKLQIDFEATAEWRRRKAAEYPDDQRNLEAVCVLEHLSATVAEVPVELLEAYFELFDGLPDIEFHQEMLRGIGFHNSFGNATQFVREYIADRTGA